MSPLTFGVWFRDTALEGVAGSIVGGLFAVGVLLLSQKFQRDSEAEMAVQNETRRLLGASRQLNQDIVAQRTSTHPAGILEVMTFTQDLGYLAVRVRPREPCYAAHLEVLSEWIAQGVFGKPNKPETKDLQVSINGNGYLQNILSHRLSDPDFFRKMSKETCDAAIAGIREDMSLPIRAE